MGFYALCSFFLFRSGWALCKVTFFSFFCLFHGKREGSSIIIFFRFFPLYFTCFDCGLLLRRLSLLFLPSVRLSYLVLLKDLGGPSLLPFYSFILFPVCLYDLYLLGTGGMAFISSISSISTFASVINFGLLTHHLIINHTISFIFYLISSLV
ncbi:hypothetical protein HOY80DRAFT_644018 [Tuber brumale]|nr:hypothetical protein HOY80DRAFT_644018 [Tuber brumale]